MTKPCAVFWDIQNVGVPKGQTVDSIVNLVRSKIIKPYNLDEIFFFCVCDAHKLSSYVCHSLTNLLFQAYDGIQDSAKIKIFDLMRKFVKLAGQDCTIILLSGDGDYYATLSELKKNHNVSIHLVGLSDSFSPKLVQISDYNFWLNESVLKPITGVDNFKISDSEPENAKKVSLQNQTFIIAHCADIRPIADIKPKTSKGSTNAEFRNVESAYVRFCDDRLTLFDYYYCQHELYHQITPWSLLYDVFERVYDFGVKSVGYSGRFHFAEFYSAYENESHKKQTSERLYNTCMLFSCYEEANNVKAPVSTSIDGTDYFDKVSVAKLYEQKSVNKKKEQNANERYAKIPWRLNQTLNLSCFVIQIDSEFHDQFMEMSRNILGNRECIFIKSIPGEIWIGFPDELICANSKRTVLRLLASLKQQSHVSMVRPSDKLLELIDFQDLVGDAYDLAFLWQQLGDLKPIPRPRIIELISIQRIKEKGCNEMIFNFTINGNFETGNHDRPKLSLEQIVKIFVKFSKVIPLAATASYKEVNLMFNSWYEAHAARHFISSLRYADVPYFTESHEVSDVTQPLECSNISEYYIINDKRKVLDKIIHKRKLEDSLNSNLAEVQSTTDIDVLDGQVGNNFQYFFAISTNSEFKFTSGMISIIKMNLVSMDCPACIEFEDQIWVGVDDLEKGNNAKDKIETIKFKLLHEKDEDDFEVGVVMEPIPSSPTNVVKMLADKSMNTTKTSEVNIHSIPSAVPLGHFNYNYRKAAGMSIKAYCMLNEHYRYEDSYIGNQYCQYPSNEFN